MRQAKYLGTVTVGGWNGAHFVLPKGARYFAISTGSRIRSEIGYCAVWVKGRIEVTNLTTGAALAPRVPWMLSTDLPPLSVGRCEFTAVEDAEWLCFDAKINNGERPALRVVEGDEAPAAGWVAHPLAPGVALHLKER